MQLGTLAELEPRRTSTMPLGFSVRVIRSVFARPDGLSVMQDYFAIDFQRKKKSGANGARTRFD